MSEFDKEAEREKLREKFAKDEEKRQSTKRMSELLLKGATMTNRHCNSCGDPLFRFDGQEFCPSCQDATVSGGQIQLRNPSGRQEAAEQSQSAEAETAETAESDPTAEPAADARAEAESTPQVRDGDGADVEPTQPPVPATDDAGASTATAAATAPVSTQSKPKGTGESNLDDARAALRRTVTRYAEEAERADDPRHARELLAAAHEAAETLAALRR
jgi:uncharacterized Zn finger protein (UPF0148 family)